MEPWQASHIQRNLSELQRNTTCNASLRAVLFEQRVLAEDDISNLDAVNNSKGELEASALLYRILLTRKRGYNALMDACKKANQTGALHILKQARPDGTLICFRSEHIEDSTTWEMLSEDLKKEIRSKLVGFQGKSVKLSECCNGLEQHIDGKFLTELVKGNTPTLVTTQVPDQLEYYIQRTLRSRNKLKSSVFQQPCNDVFVVDGMEKHQLTNLVEGAETDVSGNQIKCLTVRFITLEYEEDFERICKLSRFPVHLVKYKENSYDWIKSSGQVKTLQKYVDDDQDCFPGGDLASKGNRVNVIPDSPGMGKTVLLADIAHQISKEKPNMLIRFIVLKELAQALDKPPINLESIVSLLSEQSSEFECGRKIVKHILTSEPCVLMFDGFDEVLLNQVTTAKKILKTIMTLKSAQVFVTTRPHMREELENTLNVLGYTINPFSESDQVDFLFNFWKMKGAEVNENLAHFSKSCVDTINSKMTDFERNIAGIPLQCRLLAETYTTEAIRSSKIGFSDKNSQPLGQINSIFEMYEMHMKMRLGKISEDSIIKRLAFRLFNYKSRVEAIKNAHMYYALELLFSENIHQFHALKTNSISSNELCAVGFLEATNSNDVRFVHRTFAEFFVAWFAVEMMISESSLLFLLNELLTTKSNKEYITTPVGKIKIGTSFNFNYPVISYFINGFTKLYAKNPVGLNQLSRVSLLMDSVHYKHVSRIFLASAICDYQFVPLAVSLCVETSQLNEKGDADILELLLISAKYSSVALIKTFCCERDLTSFKTQHKFKSFVLTPLHVAVQRGHYHLVEFLARKYEPELKNLRYLLHFCLFESLKDNEGIVNEKVQIIKLLSEKNSVWLDEKLGDVPVPLLQRNVNCELKKCLIECGADVNVLDKYGNSILHIITMNPVTPEFYHGFVVSLNERKFKHFNHPNKFKLCPLHFALMEVDLSADTLNYFQSNKADFNVENRFGGSPLLNAVGCRRSVELICALIKLGADCTKKDDKGDTVLHICAEFGHHHAMHHFVKILKMDVNARNMDGCTPLHIAVLKRTSENESMQELLITNGADVNAVTNKQAFTPFRGAFRFGKGLSMRIMNLMEQHGLSIKKDDATEALMDLLSNESIFPVISTEFAQVIEFLIEKGAEIKHVQAHSPDRCKYVNIWNLDDVQKKLQSIIQVTDMSCLWPHVTTCGLLTESELQDIQNLSTDSFNKCQRFFDVVQTKKGSYERVCLLFIASNQIRPLSLLRNFFSLACANIFVTPPTFTNEFILSQQISGLNTMALVTTNPCLTIQRIRQTLTNQVLVTGDILHLLQNKVDDDLTVVKVPVVTAELISKLKTSRAAQSKIIFVCSAVREGVENCIVVTDTLPTWDDVATGYLNDTATFHCYNSSDCSIVELFKSPLILSKLPQCPFSNKPQFDFSVMKFKAGHMELQSKSYLCPTIFHYFLSDKLVINGIPIKKMKEFARFGHKIGHFDEEDLDSLDIVLIKQSHQFDEICNQNRTSKNVHLIEYEQEKGVFKLVKTWGWDENIQRFLKKTLCEGFPHCSCTPGNENLVVCLTLKAGVLCISQQTECLLPVYELTPKSLGLMKLEDAEEFFNVLALLNSIHGKLQVETDSDFIHKSHSDKIVQLVMENLSTILVESSLNYVAINTLFPNLAEQTDFISGLEKYQQLGMLKQNDNNGMVFVNQSLAWYFIAKLLMGLAETTEFDGLTSALREVVFQNCFEHQDVKFKSRYGTTALCVGDWWSQNELSSYKFINIMCFRFMDALLQKTSEGNNSNLSNFLGSIITADPEGYKWIHACVNANLFHLLQFIISLKIETIESALQMEKIVVLAVNHADVPITGLVADQFEKKANKKLTEINVYVDKEEISMVSLAALRGNYSLVEYLLNDQGFGLIFQKSDILWNVGEYFVKDSQNISGHEVNERKRIIDLLVRTDETFLEKIQLSSGNIHVDLIIYLINCGVDVHAKDEFTPHILHLCPTYLTPQEYHQVVQLIHDKDNTSIARLFQEIDIFGETPFHIAVEHLELLDETIALFSEAGVNFNAQNQSTDSIFVHAAKHFRSARLLDALYRFGADIKAKVGNGPHSCGYCWNNETAVRYLSFQGVKICDANEDEHRKEDNESHEDPSSDSD